MKKNILLVQSLLLLPLLASSALFASEKPTPKSKSAARKARKLAASSDQMKRTPSLDNLQNAAQEIDLTQQAMGAIEEQLKTMSEPTAQETLHTSVVVNEDTPQAVFSNMTEDDKAKVDAIVENIIAQESANITPIDTVFIKLLNNQDIPLQSRVSEEASKKLKTQWVDYTHQAMAAKADFGDKIKEGYYPRLSSATVKKEVVQQDAAPELPKRIDQFEVSDEAYAKFNQVLPQLVAVFADRIAQKNANTMNALEMSVYEPAPTIKQGFVSWTESIKNRWNPQWFVVDAIKDGSFDPENDSHMTALMAAAEKLVYNEQSAELKDLLDACRANPKYSNIELDEKTALKIQARFALDLKNSIEASGKIFASENETLMITHKAILERTRDQIHALEKQLAKNNEDLIKAESVYAIATDRAMRRNNRKAQKTMDGMDVLHKLYRKLPTSDAITLDRHSYAYLPVKANVDKQMETTLVGMAYTLNNLEGIHSTIKNTLKTLPAKEAVAQIANK